MIERVLIVCPDCDHDEVENDLNLTGDVERTINRALDGMVWFKHDKYFIHNIFCFNFWRMVEFKKAFNGIP